MRRREFLTTLAITGIAGCVDGGMGGETTENSEKTDEPSPRTVTERPGTSEKTEISDDPTAPATEPVPDSAISIPFEVTLDAWRAEKSLRYFDETSESIERLEPTRSWWLQPVVQVSNIGSQAVEKPAVGDFDYFAGGREVDPLDSLPVEKTQFRLPEDGTIAMFMLPGSYRTGGDLHPNEHVVYDPIFDVESLDGLGMRWETEEEGTIELGTDVVYLPD